MYQYDQYDQTIVDQRVAQYRDQTNRYLAGQLSEEEFRPLRLQNGLYIQRYAPMLRVAIPYGLLSAKQLRMLAHIARHYDKGYGHFSTRQNIQYNWPQLADVPDILQELASVEMHAIQTSGNCIRNITADQFSGVAADEIEDARPYCEILRQWSTLHPEFAYLPRKFKIAVNGAKLDRAAVHIHDIGIEISKNQQNEIGFRILVGGGMGRTPIIGQCIKKFLPIQHLLTYTEAILRVYNRYGRRDNIYKARIKILVKALGIEKFTEMVEAEWQYLKDSPSTLTEGEINRVKSFFKPPHYKNLTDQDEVLTKQLASNQDFANWVSSNVIKHKIPGYRIVTLSLKATGIAPGDASDKQMDAIAKLAEQYSFGEIRTTHEQNLVLADVQLSDLFPLWEQAKKIGLATPNIGLLTDIICCPGGDFCSLANAKSIPVADEIQRAFDDLNKLYDIGEIDLNISGCMNACGHHHVGNIGILGVDKKGDEFYQISLGGSSINDASIGKILGPSFSRNEVVNVVTKIINLYLKNRNTNERFIDTFRRIGIAPFKEHVYAKNN